MTLEWYVQSPIAGEIQIKSNKEECRSSWLRINSKCGHPDYKLARLSVNGAARDYHGNAMGTNLLLIEADWRIFDLIFFEKSIPEALQKIAHTPHPLVCTSIPLADLRERKIAATNAYVQNLLSHIPQGRRLVHHRQEFDKKIMTAHARLLKHCPYVHFGSKAFSICQRKSI